jgi:integrase
VSRSRSRARGEGSVYRRRDGRWVASLRWPTGERKYRYARTQQKALAELRDLWAVRDAGQPVPNDELTLGAWADEWMERYVSKLAYGTRRRYAQVKRDYIAPETGKPRLGRVKLRLLNVATVARWADALLADGMSPAMVAYSLMVLSSMVKTAMREELISRNPVALVRPPKYEKREANPLSEDEAVALLGADTLREHRLFALLVLAITSALREGEIAAVLWGSIEKAKARLWVRQQLQRETGRGLVVVPTKTERSKAPVALTQVFLRVLEEHRTRLIEQRMRKGARWGGSDNPVADDAYVFVTTWGTPLDGKQMWKVWAKMLKDAGIDHRRLHDSRHTTSTLLQAMGVSKDDIKEVLRHSRTATTEDYSHAGFIRQQAAAARLDELLGDVLA